MKQLKFISKITTLLLIAVVTMSEKCNSGEPSVNQGEYNSQCANRLTIQFKSIKITDKKDKPSAGKDDVSFVAMIYHDDQCTGKPLAFKNFIKIKKKDVGKTKGTGQGITVPPSLFLCPNSTIAMAIYEHDNSNNMNGQWNYKCSENLYFSTNNQPYGTIYIKYSDFDNTSSNSEKLYPLTFGEVVIKSTNAF